MATETIDVTAERTADQPELPLAASRLPPAMPLLFMAMVVSSSGLQAMNSFMPAVGRQTGISDTLIASSSALAGAIWFFAARHWARLSDRIGRKPVIMVGALGFSVSMLMIGLVVLAGVKHWIAPMVVFAGLLVSRAIFGLFGMAGGPAGQAYVAERTTPEVRASALAVLASAFGVGSIIGPAVAPLMILPGVSLAGPMFVFACLGLMSLTAIQLFLPQTPRVAAPPHTANAAPGAKGASLWRHPQIGAFAACALISGACNVGPMMILGFVVIDLMHLAPAQAQAFTGTAMMCGALAALSGQWGFIRFFRMKPRHLLLTGGLLAVSGELILAFAPNFPMLATGFAVMSLGFAFIGPGLSTKVSLAAPPGKQGEAAGVLMAAQVGGLIFAPVLAATLYHLWRPAPFLLFAVGMMAMLLIAWRKGALSRAD